MRKIAFNFESYLAWMSQQAAGQHFSYVICRLCPSAALLCSSSLFFALGLSEASFSSVFNLRLSRKSIHFKREEHEAPHALGPPRTSRTRHLSNRSSEGSHRHLPRSDPGICDGSGQGCNQRGSKNICALLIGIAI